MRLTQGYFQPVIAKYHLLFRNNPKDNIFWGLCTDSSKCLVQKHLQPTKISKIIL